MGYVGKFGPLVAYVCGVVQVGTSMDVYDAFGCSRYRHIKTKSAVSKNKYIKISRGKRNF